MAEEKEYNPDIVTVVDEDGNEHVFEELDRIETDDDKRYIALIPAYESDEEVLDSEGELIILKVEEEEDGETYLAPIEDEAEFNEVGKIFEERLSEFFEIKEED